MFVVNEQTDMGRGGACSCLDGVDGSFDGSGDGIGAKVEFSINDKTVLSDEEGRGLQ